MNTPITDAVAKLAFPDDAVDDYGGYVRMLEHARRLELDRSALMGALETLTLVIGLTPIKGNLEPLQEAQDLARAALSTARANFPES